MDFSSYYHHKIYSLNSIISNLNNHITQLQLQLNTEQLEKEWYKSSQRVSVTNECFTQTPIIYLCETGVETDDNYTIDLDKNNISKTNVTNQSTDASVQVNSNMQTVFVQTDIYDKKDIFIQTNIHDKKNIFVQTANPQKNNLSIHIQKIVDIKPEELLPNNQICDSYILDEIKPNDILPNKTKSKLDRSLHKAINKNK